MKIPNSSEIAIARFLRNLSAAALDLAFELESTMVTDKPSRMNLRDAGLGTLQLAVANAVATADPSHGLSPREVAKAIHRDDEPNIRTALNRLAERGVAERLPDLPTQRWRLAMPYRHGNVKSDDGK